MTSKKSYRKKTKRKMVCSNSKCRVEIPKGSWYYKHDNIYNRINPFYFCSVQCYTEWLFKQLPKIVNELKIK